MKWIFLQIMILLALAGCTSQKTVSQSPKQADPQIPKQLPSEDIPPLKTGAPGFIRFDQQEEAMLQAVQGLSEFERQQTRFIICSDQYNSDGVDAVKLCKDGVTKALNSISSERDIEDVKAIGPAGSIMQIQLDDFGLTPSKWRLIEQADLFKFTSQTVRGRTLQFLTQTVRPFINGTNFNESALIGAYTGLTEIPSTFQAFQQKLGVNVQQEFDNRDPDMIAMGVNESVITANRQFRLMWRVSTRDGSLWCTEDTNDQAIPPVNIEGQLINQKNLLEAPFPLFARSAKTFKQDAGECIYTLPNGGLGFALFDKNDVRQDFAPTNIVQDTAAASQGLSGTIQNGRSCFRCHATGFIPVRDSLAGHIAANTAFNAGDKQRGRIFFKNASEGARLFSEDNERYGAFLKALGVNNPSEDPVNALTDIIRKEQDARQVAGLLGITEDELKTGLRASTAASAVIGSLLQPNGKVDLASLKAGLPLLIADMNLFQDDI